jgi:hypothetical protein
MTQALAAFDEHGMVLATDSRATRFDAAGAPEVFNVKKLFPLGPHCAILSGGAGVSVPLSLELRQVLARHRGLLDPEEIAQFALPFLSQGSVGREAPLAELLDLSKDFLAKQAALKEEVGPPFYFATITREGVREVAV